MSNSQTLMTVYLPRQLIPRINWKLALKKLWKLLQDDMKLEIKLLMHILIIAMKKLACWKIYKKEKKKKDFFYDVHATSENKHLLFLAFHIYEINKSTYFIQQKWYDVIFILHAIMSALNSKKYKKAKKRRKLKEWSTNIIVLAWYSWYVFI